MQWGINVIRYIDLYCLPLNIFKKSFNVTHSQDFFNAETNFSSPNLFCNIFSDTTITKKGNYAPRDVAKIYEFSFYFIFLYLAIQWRTSTVYFERFWLTYLLDGFIRSPIIPIDWPKLIPTSCILYQCNRSNYLWV